MMFDVFCTTFYDVFTIFDVFLRDRQKEVGGSDVFLGNLAGVGGVGRA